VITAECDRESSWPLNYATCQFYSNSWLTVRMNFAKLLGDVLNHSVSGTDISQLSKMFFNQRLPIFFCLGIFAFSLRTVQFFIRFQAFVFPREDNGDRHVCTPLCGGRRGRKGERGI